MKLTTRTLSTVCTAGLAIAALAGPAAAEDREFSWSVNAAGTSDYMFRGVSQTDNEPALSGGLDIGYGIFYAGVWASNVNEDFISTDLEVDLYAGIKPVWNKLTFDLAVLYYAYPGQDAKRIFGLDEEINVNYWEFKAGVSYAVTDAFAVGVNYYYSPDNFGETGVAHTVEGNASYSLPKFWVFDPVINAVLGYQESELPAFPADDNGPDADGDGAPDLNDTITYWNAGLALTVEAITLDFRYWDSDIDSDISDERFVFTTKVVLP